MDKGSTEEDSLVLMRCQPCELRWFNSFDFSVWSLKKINHARKLSCHVNSSCQWEDGRSQVITVLLILGERTRHDDFTKHLGKFSDINVCIRIEVCIKNIDKSKT